MENWKGTWQCTSNDSMFSVISESQLTNNSAGKIEDVKITKLNFISFRWADIATHTIQDNGLDFDSFGKGLEWKRISEQPLKRN